MKIFKMNLTLLGGGKLFVNVLLFAIANSSIKKINLLIYPGNLWKRISGSFEELSGLNPEIRNLQWNFLGNAHYIDFEISDRMTILLPLSLRSYAQLKEKAKVVLIGMGQKFELWSEKNWKIKESGKKLNSENTARPY